MDKQSFEKFKDEVKKAGQATWDYIVKTTPIVVEATKDAAKQVSEKLEELRKKPTSEAEKPPTPDVKPEETKSEENKTDENPPTQPPL